MSCQFTLGQVRWWPDTFRVSGPQSYEHKLKVKDRLAYPFSELEGLGVTGVDILPPFLSKEEWSDRTSVHYLLSHRGFVKSKVCT